MPWVVKGCPLPSALHQLVAPGWLMPPTLARPGLPLNIQHLQEKSLIQFSSPFLLLGGFGCCGCWLWQWGFGSGEMQVANGLTAGNAIGLGAQGRTVTELVSCFPFPLEPAGCAQPSHRETSRPSPT